LITTFDTLAKCRHAMQTGHVANRNTNEREDPKMGLDMYLNARKYISPTDYQATREKNWEEIVPDPQFAELKKFFPTRALQYQDGGAEVKMNVMYWRKANQIHGWFVDHPQNGVDECQETDVSHDDLRALLELCRKVQANPSEAPNLLPVTGGFFFGNYDPETGYDEYYFAEIEITIKALEVILEELPEGEYEFSYRSSW
jgi:hypothetical protein